ncbi:hypothetical protein JRQ81_011265 [Phrynocephalus forsythii]|uniref:Mitochondrial ribosomal protein S24 n=1 Tax=Phrynocephalus forsythii TaxID=171643 RepID=A0A9Q1ARH4_9SAUR|nr:hypothetical protein JRQ81_011265 [Phrynocephalus forsythii]
MQCHAKVCARARGLLRMPLGLMHARHLWGGGWTTGKVMLLLDRRTRSPFARPPTRKESRRKGRPYPRPVTPPPHRPRAARLREGRGGFGSDGGAKAGRSPRREQKPSLPPPWHCGLKDQAGGGGALAGRRVGGVPSWLLRAGQAFHTTASCPKAKAARIRGGKGKRPVTYEEAHPPHYIAHRKGWLSQHTSHLCEEEGAAERAVEDVFIRKFIYGTFHGLLANEIVLKRRANTLIICAILLQKMVPHKLYFLIGYTETLLSFLYKCPVKMEVQTVPEKVIYKYV